MWAIACFSLKVYRHICVSHKHTNTFINIFTFGRSNRAKISSLHNKRLFTIVGLILLVKMFYCFRFFFRFSATSISFTHTFQHTCTNTLRNSFAVSVWRCFITFFFSILYYSSQCICFIFISTLNIFVCFCYPKRKKTTIVVLSFHIRMQWKEMWYGLLNFSFFLSLSVCLFVSPFLCNSRHTHHCVLDSNFLAWVFVVYRNHEKCLHSSVL